MGSRLESSIKLFNGDPNLPVVDFEMGKILAGKAYALKYLWEDVADAASVSLYIKSLTAFAVPPFMAFNFYVGGNYRVYTYCSPTIYNDGTELTAVNRNFLCCNNIEDTDIYADPTITDNGNSLGNALIPGGVGIARVGGSAYLYKAIMPLDTEILFIMTNTSGGVADISLDAAIFL